ncbi:MAG: hypothetical protein FJZ58_00145 [Chlamydiae bacterium]|nr:hypothetical protein [Chlamydiota bacterium]
MDKDFSIEKAKKFLASQEKDLEEQKELKRLAALELAISVLKSMFSHTPVEVYLVGSITRPLAFHAGSDVDIVVKNFKGDRFELWTQLESKLQRTVEVILFENCLFQEHVITQGLRVT